MGEGKVSQECTSLGVPDRVDGASQRGWKNTQEKSQRNSQEVVEEPSEVGGKTMIKGWLLNEYDAQVETKKKNKTKQKQALRLMAVSKTNFEIDHFSQKH